MKKKYIAYGLILIELIIQIIGFIDYDGAPAFLWTLADAIVFLVPLLFGTRLGLICLLPVAVSEIVWFLSYHSVGALLHLLSFAIAVIILGTVNKKLNQTTGFPRVIFSIILFIAFWVGRKFCTVRWSRCFCKSLLPGRMSLNRSFHQSQLFS